MSLPKVVIVGFPNVGKSTLFNRFLQKKKSLVHSLPGMTRDWVSDIYEINGRKVLLVDTGGFFDSREDPFSNSVKEKAWTAAREADLLLLVLDRKRPLSPAEEELYFLLKKLNKSIFVVVNKADSSQEEEDLTEYYRLGADNLFAVSAEHKRSLEILESAVKDFFPEAGSMADESRPLRIAVVGRINVGKSSIVNRLSGQDRLIVSEIPGTTRDSTDTLIYRNKKPFVLVDTAGIRKMSRITDKREKASIVKAKKDIPQADVVCLVLDAREFPTRQDTAIAHLALESGKPLLLVLNKWDLIPEEKKSVEEVRRRVFSKLEFVSYAPLLFISALSGRRVVKILDSAEDVYASGCRRIPTPKLNEFLQRIAEVHPPVSRRNDRIKVKYITQTGILPPLFVLFTHSRFSLAPAYKKFLTNRLSEEFGFIGTPLRIVMRSEHRRRNQPKKRP